MVVRERCDGFHIALLSLRSALGIRKREFL